MRNEGIISDGVLLTAEDQLDGDTAAEFASFIDDMNSTENADAWITVMRIPTDSRGTPLPNSKHLGQLFNEPLGTSSVNDVIERIRREFIRPGENSITVRIVGKQQGQRGLKFNRIYTIERPNKGETANNPTGSVAEMLALMQSNAQQQAERTEAFMREMMTLQRTSQVSQGESIVDQLVKLAPILTPVISAIMGRAPAPAGGGATELLATVRTLKEASGLFSGQRDEGGDTMSTVKAVAEAVAPGLKFLAARAETDRMTAAERMRRLPPPERAKVVPLKTPPPTARAKVAPQAPNNSEGEDMNLKDMREKFETVAQLCDEGQTPEAVAELIVDNCEEDQLEELYRRVEPENFVAQAKVLAPRAVAGREEWFAKLRLAILDEFEEDPDAPLELNGAGTATSDSTADLAADPVDVNEIPDVTN